MSLRGDPMNLRAGRRIHKKSSGSADFDIAQPVLLNFTEPRQNCIFSNI